MCTEKQKMYRRCSQFQDSFSFLFPRIFSRSNCICIIRMHKIGSADQSRMAASVLINKRLVMKRNIPSELVQAVNIFFSFLSFCIFTFFFIKQTWSAILKEIRIREKWETIIRKSTCFSSWLQAKSFQW